MQKSGEVNPGGGAPSCQGGLVSLRAGTFSVGVVKRGSTRSGITPRQQDPGSLVMRTAATATHHQGKMEALALGSRPGVKNIERQEMMAAGISRQQKPSGDVHRATRIILCV